MALIKSTILAQISGSVNGITFAHNRGGAYMRNRSLPTNPGSDRQDQVRTAMASLAAAWKEVLTEDERVLWRNFGANTQVQNRIGDTIRLSGIAAFQRVNLFRMSTLGLDSILSPPDPVGAEDPAPTFGSAVVGSIAAAAPILDVTLVGVLDGTYSLAYYYSGPLSPGLNFYRGPYVAHDTMAASTSPVPLELTAFGTEGAGAGSKVAAKLTCYHTASGLPIWTVYVDPLLIPEPV